MDTEAPKQSFLSEVWTLLEASPAEQASEQSTPAPAGPVAAQSSAPGEEAFQDNQVPGSDQVAFDEFLDNMDIKLASAFTTLGAKVLDAHAGQLVQMTKQTTSLQATMMQLLNMQEQILSALRAMPRPTRASLSPLLSPQVASSSKGAGKRPAIGARPIGARPMDARPSRRGVKTFTKRSIRPIGKGCQSSRSSH
eukprot:4360744-Amphidinium_carterae.1